MQKLQKKQYWKEATLVFKDTKMITFAAVIVALRVLVKFFKIPLAAGLSLTLDCYINSLGAFVYGPLMSLIVGAVSDTLGAIIAPSGTYFFPFIFVEMTSSFIFALFLWKKELSVMRIIISKFTVNFVCNIVMNSLLMKWYYFVFFGVEKAEAYSVINIARIVKNLITFPFESAVICIILGAFIPVLKNLSLVQKSQNELILSKKHIIFIAVLTVVSVALILFYIFFLKQLLAK